jgi:hypothetical protein
MTSIYTKVYIPNEVLFHDLNGEAVLLNLQNGKYFGLDSTGTRIWNLLVELGDIAAAYQVLQEEYDVDPDQLRSDLLALVDQLAVNGLVRLEQRANVHED